MAFVESVKSRCGQGIQIRQMMLDVCAFEPFTFIRFSDGELMMLLGHDIRMSRDGAWIGNNKITNENFKAHDCKSFSMSEDREIFNMLTASLKHRERNYIRGLPLACCVGEQRFNLLKTIDNCYENATTANLLINSNYGFFFNKFAPILLTARPLIMIANKRADLKLFSKVVYHIKLGDDCKEDIGTITTELLSLLRDIGANMRRNVLILSAASYISNILGWMVSQEYPECTFIDIGTAMHPHVELGLPRHYHQLYFKSPNRYKYHECDI